MNTIMAAVAGFPTDREEADALIRLRDRLVGLGPAFRVIQWHGGPDMGPELG